MKNDPRERIELADPRRTIKHRPGVNITRVPALHDAGRTEIDVLGMVLAIELRRQQPHHMHPRRTTVTGQFRHRIAVTLSIWQSAGRVAEVITQTMRRWLSHVV